MELIRTENLNKIYNDNEISVHALKDINLKIEKGEYTVICGESGSGKTTLLNALGTLDMPTEGKIFLEGQDISKKTQKELSNIRLNKIGFIFQAYNLIPVLTAIENIEFAMMLKGVSEKERREKVFEMMKYLKIEELGNKLPNQMSGGQQQRVAVARAIVNDPAIILADEPTANLDYESGENLLELMQKMNEEKGITFLFSSHDRQVMDKAKRLITLRDGKIESDKK
jgi:putative ABC transport system ATP-binding protein